jgi:ArsR family transcriptional regulator
MRHLTPTDFAKRARIIKAMAHPSRLTMLHALAAGEKCVCDLRDLVGADLSTVSKHLSVMKKAGLVDDRKEGLRVHYRLRVPCVLDFMNCIEAVQAADGTPARQRQACCAR